MISKNSFNNIFKVSLIIFLILFSIHVFSQNRINQKLYIKELKSIFKDSKNNNLELMFLNIDGTYTLPAYFTNYKEYIQKINYFGQNKFWYTFEETKSYDVLL